MFWTQCPACGRDEKYAIMKDNIMYRICKYNCMNKGADDVHETR